MFTRIIKNRASEIFGLTIFLGLFAFGQIQAGTLKGAISDRSDGIGLMGAVVTARLIDNSQEFKQVPTDEGGNFEMSGLIAGTYLITISYIGFATETIENVTIQESGEFTISLALTPSAINLGVMAVSASRRPEKILDAPASVTVIDAEQIRSITTLSATDHLKGMSSVDVMTTGMNSSNVVVRGFNNIFSTTLLTLVDNRYARVPSLRVNVYQFIPTVNGVVERIELVRGPGSALYGPNSTDGVLHVITSSPFSSQGTTVSLAGGERELFMGSFRHAGVINDRVGYRFSGQYYSADDWKFNDPLEIDTTTLFRQTATGNVYDATRTVGPRDFGIEKLSGEARFDFLVGKNGTLIFNTGFNRASNIELTGLGAAQAVDWLYGYGQVRYTNKDLFVQAFVNGSDAGDTYLRRSGAKIIDKSKIYVGQIQHSSKLGERQRFTYGFDALLSRPSTDNTIHGANEDIDDINEFGIYLQSETQLSDKFKFVAAGRLDDHNLINDKVFSPRAALSYHPSNDHNLRVTFNQAFSTPSSLNFFLDVLSASIDAPSSIAPVIGPTIFNVRGTGSADGFTFNIGNDGRPLMVSLYGPALFSAGAISAPNAYLPPDVNSVWPVIRGMVLAQSPGLSAFLPASLGATVPGQYAVLNTVTGSFDPFDPANLADVAPIEETKKTSFEVGYKGIIANRIAASADVYYTKIKDFIGPLRVETPHLFIDSAAFVSTLTTDMVDNGLDPATAAGTAIGIYNQFGPLPIGLVSPQEWQNPTDVALTYRNFGDIDMMGVDLALTYYVNRSFDITGNYSYISKDLFKNLDNITDLAINAPRHKFGGSLQYRNHGLGFKGKLSYRWVDGFPVNSGIYVGSVEKYSVVDLTVNYDLLANLSLGMTMQNVLDNKHSEFVGVPAVGRLTIMRLTQTF